MNEKEEIEELKSAYQASPGNSYLQKMLIKKMNGNTDYYDELEPIVQHALKQEPHNIFYKEVLINIYYFKEKLTTCIVIAEEVRNFSLFSVGIKVKLAKCYLREGNIQEAQHIYELVVNEDEGFNDDELDQALRLPEMPGAESEDMSAIFSRPSLGFSDVGGMDDVKREIEMKIIKPLENAALFASYGKKVGGGILLYGPPGCGKTFIAKATAGEINANFINISLNDILDMWVGSSEKNLANYFEMARSKTPCVLFFDEVDALGAKRSDLRQSAGKNVINQFLAEMDGIHADNEGVLIIGATNAPWHLDPAFRRPGRFDRIIFVPPPDARSKEAILKLKLEGKPQKNIDYSKISRKTPEFSGADINAIIDIAVESILERAMETGVPEPITTKHLLEAIKKHKASTIDWFTSAKNYAMFANKSGLYDGILKYLK